MEATATKTLVQLPVLEPAVIVHVGKPYLRLMQAIMISMVPRRLSRPMCKVQWYRSLLI